MNKVMSVGAETEIRNFSDALSNGLTLVTVEMPHIHAVEIAMFVRAGLRFETPADNGISHFLEHMMFRGNKKYPDSILLNREFEKIGRDLRASTLSEYTYFGFSPHTSKLEKGMEVFADFFREPVFPSIENERAIILEEYLEEVNSEGNNVDINNIACKFIYENNALALTTIGTEESIRNIDRDMLEDYFQKYYNPANMVLVAAGAVSHDQVLPLAKKYFELIPSHGAVVDKNYFLDTVPQNQNGLLTVFQEDDDSQFQLQVCFHAISYNHPDYYALCLINRMFDDGVTSRLQRALREDRGMTYSGECRATSLSDIGTFDFDLTVSPEKLCPAANILLDEIKIFLNAGPSEEELSHVKMRAGYELDFDLDDPYKQIIRYGFSRLYSEPVSVEQEKSLIDRVTLDDIRRLSRKIFVVKHMNVVLLGPDLPEPRKELEALVNNFSF
ncbi:MAG: insulinase family protein [Nitrospinae bacterium]|nr:insulinase family protein [Nitrospinota bacterium]